jgi:hypothetical protein
MNFRYDPDKSIASEKMEKLLRIKNLVVFALVATVFIFIFIALTDAMN